MSRFKRSRVKFVKTIHINTIIFARNIKRITINFIDRNFMMNKKLLQAKMVLTLIKSLIASPGMIHDLFNKRYKMEEPDDLALIGHDGIMEVK